MYAPHARQTDDCFAIVTLLPHNHSYTRIHMHANTNILYITSALREWNCISIGVNQRDLDVWNYWSKLEGRRALRVESYGPFNNQ